MLEYNKILYNYNIISLERENALRKNPTPFAVSLKFTSSRKTRFLQNMANLVKVNRKEGLYIGGVLVATTPLWLPLAIKGVKKDTLLKW